MGGWRPSCALRAAAVVGALVITATVLLNGGVASASMRGLPKAMVGCWDRHAPALPVGTSAGVWLMQIKSGELLAFTPGTKSCSAQADFTGTLSVTGSHLTIGPLPVCPTKGVYTWKASAASLTLQASSDKCASRKLLFTGVWKKA